MAAQLPDAAKVKQAHYVIDNSGSLDASEAQVRQVYALLKKAAEQTA
jgi:dephospho-CoA kinase